MTPVFVQDAGRSALAVLPMAATAALVLLSAVPTHLPNFQMITPVFALAAVYFFAIYQPSLLPPPAVFAIGLFQDALLGLPFGLTALVLLGAYGVVVNQRNAFRGRPFLITWAGFAVVTPATIAITWAIVSFLAGAFVPPTAAAFQALLTVAIYPLINVVLAALARLLPTAA
ncbi:MAG: rod shape-determining protein MreD [Gemmatimonas sp.]